MKADQSKTPGAMVLMPRMLAEKMLDGSASMGWSMAEDLRAVLAALSEQPPAVGGSIADRIRAATIADSGQEGVNIAEGRFGKAMAALCLQLDGEAPAVGGNMVSLIIRDLCETEPDDDPSAVHVRMLELESILEWHVAPLLGEIERLRGLQPGFPPRPPEGSGMPRFGLRWNGPQQPLAVPMDDGYWTPWHLADQFCARIAELGAQQGEPVAYMVISTSNRPEKCTPQDPEGFPVYRQARPATAKLEMADVVRAHMEIPQCPVLTSNQCHSLAVKLNAVLSK